MVAYDDLGSLVPIKRTLQVIDYQNQANKDLEKGTFSTQEIKRQEAIFELSRGEQDLIEDLQLARKAYHDPMLKLSIMSEDELTQIFGNLDTYIPLHQELLARLSSATGPDGTVGQIGSIVVSWLPRLNAYRDYCSNQLAAKALLDQKKQDPRVQDFLQRCLESPFSRKLDLWSFLDIPRSRLVKYPLLLREILRHTPAEHPDTGHLEQAITIIQGVLADINTKKGESECQYYIDKLDYLDERQRDARIHQCKSLLCHGELRNKSGTKLHVFLFTELLVLSRPVSRGGPGEVYQVYRQPIPVQSLVLEDLQDGDVRMGGSFRGAFSNADKAKNIFRVRFQEPGQGQSHTLQVNDIFHKQQWLNCLRSAISVHRPDASAVPVPPVATAAPATPTAATKRRPSSASAIVHMEEVDENAAVATTAAAAQRSQSAPCSPCGSDTPSFPSPSSSSSSSPSSTPTSPLASPLASPMPRKSKKDKRSLCSLGKRKETMAAIEESPSPPPPTWVRWVAGDHHRGGHSIQRRPARRRRRRRRRRSRRSLATATFTATSTSTTSTTTTTTSTSTTTTLLS
ncbi:hypothetical protein CRUP_013356 [Coryphaenoides rupestris]|nr:hypothetical protein CRUP_013356 [Coryphaenoides rupestris]